MFKQLSAVIAGLLLAALAAMSTPALAQTPSPMAEASGAAASMAQAVDQSLLQKKILDLKEQNKELASDLRSTQAMVLEVQRKSIDWWLTLTGLILTGVGILAALAGFLLPQYLNHEKNRLLKETQAEFERMNAEAKATLDRLKVHEKDGAKSAEKASTNAEEIANKNADLGGTNVPAKLNLLVSTSEVGGTITTSQAFQTSAQASDADKLRARAHLASQIQHPSIEQAIVAYEQWYALTLLNPRDANAHGNAGVMAHKLYELAAKPSQEHWLSLERWHYTMALSIKEEMPDVAFNFGNLLAREALMFYASRNLAAAQTKWHLAGEKYAEALANRKDMSEAASNWSTALLNEAQAILHNNPHDVEVANERIARAEQVLETQAELSEASRVFVAYSLACVYSLQHHTEKAMPQLELSRSNWKHFPGPEHVMKDTALANLRVTPEFQTWFKHHFPNHESPTT